VGGRNAWLGRRRRFFFYILLKTRVLFVFFTRFVIVSLSLTYTPTRRVSRIYNRSLRYTFGSLRIISNNALRVRTREKENFLLVFLKLSKQFQRTNSIDNRLEFFFPPPFFSVVDGELHQKCLQWRRPPTKNKRIDALHLLSIRKAISNDGGVAVLNLVYLFDDGSILTKQQQQPPPPIHS
jgi:hypothetical protein